MTGLKKEDDFLINKKNRENEPKFLVYTSCASAKKKTPTMEILPDKKELIMKGGTFQEQLSAFQ